ncbi:MAG: hypothetical protein AB1449_06430 [Chloroflexota bacterium]
MSDKKPAEEAARRRGPRIPDEARAHFKAAREEMRKSVEALFPPEFLAHRRAARREMLLAMRSLIDHALQHMEERKPA